MNFFRNYCCVLVLCLFGTYASAQGQQPVSLYLQTENNQAFSVRWGAKNFESSSSGYLLVPQVAAGSQSFTVAFKEPEKSVYTFTVIIGTEPKGYSLRQAVDNSWSLFDMVEWAMVKGLSAEPAPKIIIAEKPLAPLPVPVAEEKSLEKIPVKFVETPAVNTNRPAIVKPREPRITAISKIFDKLGATGIDQVYVLTNGTKSDTIALFIPVLAEEIPKTGTNPAAVLLQDKRIDVAALRTDRVATRQRYLLLSN